MKKTLFYTALLFAGTVLMTGCGKDDEKGETFSDLTVEEHKKNLEDEGIAIVQDLEDISNLEAIKAAQQLVELMNIGSNLAAPQLITAVAELSADNLGSLKAITTTTRLQSEFNNAQGIYSWNNTYAEFEKETKAGEITYKFPSQNSQTNDLSITINNFKTSAPVNLTGSGYELLQSVTATFKTGSKAILTFTMTGEYNSDDIPTKLIEKLEFAEGYIISNTFTNNSSRVSWEQAFKKGSKNLITYYMDANGNMSYSNIQNTINKDDEAAMEQDIVNNATMSIAIGNIKAEGNIDLKGLLSDAQKNQVIPSEEYQEEADADKAASILNKYVKIAVKYNSSNEIICKCKFVTVQEKNYYTNYYTNDMSMEFADGSKVDDSFFGNGFTKFITNATSLMNAMENNYGLE